MGNRKKYHVKYEESSEPKKPRPCLRCDKIMMCTASNRICPECSEINKRFSGGISCVDDHVERKAAYIFSQD